MAEKFPMHVAWNTSLAAAAVFCFCAGALAADSGWQSVTLDNNPAFTIEVISALGKSYLPSDEERANGFAMSFAYETKDNGAVACSVGQVRYESYAPRDELVTGMTMTPGFFCSSPPGATGEKRLFSNAAVSNGSPAAVCATSYALGSASDGYVFSVLTVAAPDKIYRLNCITQAANQNTAEKLWNSTWAKYVAHIQQSMHLPVQGQFRK